MNIYYCSEEKQLLMTIWIVCCDRLVVSKIDGKSQNPWSLCKETINVMNFHSASKEHEDMMNGDTETPVHNNIKDDNEAVAESKATTSATTMTTMDQQEATKCDSTSVDINDVKRNLEFENVREISKGDKQDFLLFLLA